jgi:hypothetical protein
MEEPTWKLLKEVDVAAGPAIWTRAVDYIADVVTLKFESSGTWNYDQQNVCGPDGIANITGSELMKADEPLGCLLGKFGGSTAGRKDGTPFVVGAFAICILPPPAALGAAAPSPGPLYLGMNRKPTGSGEKGSLKVKIFQLEK